MTKQETFDIVVKGIIAQGKPSERNGNCAYRGEGGTKCAAGQLIPDEKYNPEFEGAKCFMFTPPDGSRGARVKMVMQALSEEGHDPEFVRALQEAHDYSANYEDFLSQFKLRAKTVAKEYGLSTSALEPA